MFQSTWTRCNWPNSFGSQIFGGFSLGFASRGLCLFDCEKKQTLLDIGKAKCLVTQHDLMNVYNSSIHFETGNNKIFQEDSLQNHLLNNLSTAFKRHFDMDSSQMMSLGENCTICSNPRWFEKYIFIYRTSILKQEIKFLSSGLF